MSADKKQLKVAKTLSLFIYHYCHLLGIFDCYAFVSLPLFRASAYQTLEK
jgi:hypothetical protein